MSVAAATRTPLGVPGGGLAGTSCAELATLTATAALREAGRSASEVDRVVAACAVPPDTVDLALGRAMARALGVPASAPAQTLAGVDAAAQAILIGSAAVANGDADVVLVAAADSATLAPYWLPGLRFGARVDDAHAVDPLAAALDPLATDSPPNLAEEAAAQGGIDRRDQDALALRSHSRAGAPPGTGNGDGRAAGTPLERDERVSPKMTGERLAALKPIFDSTGTVTAGNSAHPADGGAALVLARPQGSPSGAPVVVGVGLAGNDDGRGAGRAAGTAIGHAGVALADVDTLFIDEASAAAALVAAADLGASPEDVNPSGGEIALGRPVGAESAVLTSRLCAELRRSDGELGLFASGGPGTAIALALRRA